MAEFWTEGNVVLARLEEVAAVETGVLVEGSKEKVFLWGRRRRKVACGRIGPGRAGRASEAI